MTLKKLNSKFVSAVGYDPSRKLLEVKFKLSGRVYAFLDVQKETYQQFVQAKSKAEFFKKFIKNNYKNFLLG